MKRILAVDDEYDIELVLEQNSFKVDSVRNYNHAINPPTGYFSEKLSIVTRSIKKLFLHVTRAADAAAKPTQQHIELEQMTRRGHQDLP